MGQLEQAGEVRQCVIQDSPEGAGAVGALLGLPEALQTTALSKELLHWKQGARCDC